MGNPLKNERTAAILQARRLAERGKVAEARAILAQHDVQHAAIEIVPGPTRKGEVL